MLIDMKSGYHQIEIEVSAFTVGPLGVFNIMPFRLDNSPATFQCIIDEVLRYFNTQPQIVSLDTLIDLLILYIQKQHVKGQTACQSNSTSCSFWKSYIE